MTKFVYVEFEGKGLYNETLVLSKGYLNVDYIVSIPMPFKYRQVELNTGCVDDMNITSGTKYYTLTEKSFNSLLKELNLEEKKDKCYKR